jgi:hypothetical protein
MTAISNQYAAPGGINSAQLYATVFKDMKQQELLKSLSAPWIFEFLSGNYRSDPESMAELLFSDKLANEGSFSKDCTTINKLWRDALRFVHPDKVPSQDRQVAHVATANLNVARDILGCGRKQV